MNKKKTLVAYGINFIAVTILFSTIMFAVGSGSVTRYITGIMMSIFINIILVASLNLATGFLGQIALGHAGFMAVGAYSAAIFVKYVHSTGAVLMVNRAPTPLGTGVFIASIIIAGLMAAVFGLLIGIPALRLKGDYLAIITLGFGEIIRVMIENMTITGGAQGLTAIPKLATLPVVYIIMVISLVVLYTFVRSRHGRAITAIREDDIAAASMGINNTYYKVLAFTVSAFFAGIAGGIYAQYLGVLRASDFDFTKSIDILVMVVLGGMGSLTGSIISAIGLTTLPELLRTFSDYRMLIYSVVLIMVMIFKPSGLFGKYEFSLTRCIKKITSKLTKTAAKEEPDHE